MRFGIVGLGRMGANIAVHAIEKGHSVAGYDAGPMNQPIRGLDPARSLEDLIAMLDAAPRVVILYVPHGDPTQSVCDSLAGLLAEGDLVVDGGNSHWKDSIRRSDAFSQRGIGFLDVGTSGGVAGAKTGACFMVGGDRAAFDVVAPLLRDLAIDDEAVAYVGPSGSGHFTKLVHNAIEFGMVQSIAEGVEMLQRSGFALDLPALLTNWNHGSVIRSWLIELMGIALSHETNFAELSTYVEDTQEVKWVLAWAMENDIPTPAITQSQTSLMSYRDLDWPQAKAVALLRNQYGGHPVHRAGDPPARA